MHRLKGEAIKTTIMLGQADHYLTGPMTAYHHNLIVRTAPRPRLQTHNNNSAISRNWTTSRTNFKKDVKSRR